MSQSGSILARVPEDIGKKVRWDHSYTETVRDGETCERCDKRPVALYIQGETDSFGIEVLHWCKECDEETKSSSEDYDEALDIEDRKPKPGHVFVVNETTNIDQGADYFHQGQSYRRAASYLRAIEPKAARLGGLYPGRGIQEITEAELNKSLEARRAAAAEVRDYDDYPGWEEDRAYDMSRHNV